MKKYLIIPIAFLSFATVVSANISYFANSVSTATATTTQSVVSPISTITLTYDSYNTSSSKTDNAVLLVQHIASSSASVVGAKVQYSQDGSDWFTYNNSSITSSTTLPTPIYESNTYTLTGNTTSSTTRNAIFLETPTRFMRVVFSAVTATSSVWATIIPVKQN